MQTGSFNWNRRRWLQASALGAAGGLIAPYELLGQDTAPVRKLEPAPCFARKDIEIRSAMPPNGEPRLGSLVESWITPVKHFYVRSHAPTPKIDVDSFALRVEGMVDKPQTFTLAQLKDRLPAHIVTATLTCAGNRRTEHNAVKQVGGVQWEAGAIGNARWGGPALADVLKAVGVQPAAKHVWFEGLDQIKKGDGIIPFGGSIPLERAMQRGPASVLLAHAMNGKPLPPEHGFPLRTLAPGYIGARSVKWLGKIIVSDRPSPNHYLATAYKLVTESTDEAWAAAEPLMGFPINSVICKPITGAKVKAPTVEVAGYALPTGSTGATISRVELSTDGRKWVSAELDTASRPYCWRLWKANVEVSDRTKAISVRALDSQGGMQPSAVDWNLKGYMFNAWHRAQIDVS
ncbi:MAG: molybdopterin-dependent oxidoreductase [bacterium]|nr:molybdopterin-dependent oxidoreductase [bacterium]